ncbi:MAG: hypothetical protein NZ959_10350, partial [Armatimonadetes bacterium]|nr:hypothetical protein [Armatimonadota bacterium]
MRVDPMTDLPLLDAVVRLVNSLGFPVAAGIWMMWIISRMLVLSEIVAALVRLDEKVERVLLLLQPEQNDGDAP